MPFSDALREYTTRADMTPEQAISYRLGALEARLICQAAAHGALEGN
jgi:hypothetical protein